MRIVLVSLLLLVLPLYALADSYENKDSHDMAEAATADAAADAELPARIAFEAGCLSVPCGACEIDEVNIAITCCKDPCECCPEGFDATLRIEFTDGDNAVIAMGDVKGRFCDICSEKEYTAKLSQSVCPQDIKGARVSVFDGPEHGIGVETLVIRARDPYGRLGVCPKWHKLFKCSPECCQQLGGDTDWVFSVDCCACSKCSSGGCKSRCGCKSSCSSCNKCDKKKGCGCKACCDKPAKKMPECKCQKCSSGGCGKCGDKGSCSCKSSCGCGKANCGGKCKSSCGCKGGCDKCAKKACGCKAKCGKCETKCKPDCKCSRCKPSCGGCGKCDKCKSSCGCGGKCH